MNGKIENQVFFPCAFEAAALKQGVRQQQMAAGTDRQEFGDALDERENGNVKKRHG